MPHRVRDHVRLRPVEHGPASPGRSGPGVLAAELDPDHAVRLCPCAWSAGPAAV